MAFEQGTATDHVDLLNRFSTFVTTNANLVSASQNWSVLSTTTPTDYAFDNFYYFRAPGLSTTEEIYMNMGCVSSVNDDSYNLFMRGALNYDSNVEWSAQPGASPGSTMFLWNQSIPYWFVANGQRAIIVAKISTYYSVIYVGKINPTGSPSQVPMPLFIGGTDSLTYERWSDSTSTFNISCFMSPGSGCYLYTVGGGWQRVRNRLGGGNGNTDTTSIQMGPTAAGGFSTTSTVNWAGNWGRIKKNLDNTYTMIPFFMYVNDNNPSKNSFGTLDGAFWVTGDNNSAENIITKDGDDYLVVQNMHRTEWTEYAAIRLV